MMLLLLLLEVLGLALSVPPPAVLCTAYMPQKSTPLISTCKATRAPLPAAGRRRLHLRQRNLARPPSCNRPAPNWAWWSTVHRSIDGVHREAECDEGWCCYTSFAFGSRGLKPADMISIAHLASHFLAPGSRVADLNNGEMVCLCYTAVLTRLVVLSFSLTIDHALFTMSATPRDLHEP